MTIYIVYKTTNLINGRYYIGKHKTSNLDDSYLGSGRLLKNAIQKYGKENFKKEILRIFECEDDAFDYEQKIVNESVVSDQHSYNLSTGGLGGRTHSKVSKKMMSESKKGCVPWNKGISSKDWMTDEQYENAVDNLTNRTITSDEIERRKQSRSGYKHSDETKKKVSEKLKGRKFSPETIEKMRMAKLGKNRKAK